nr:MAG: RNA-dependent RNA polymerase [Yunnan birna-like virus 2]
MLAKVFLQNYRYDTNIEPTLVHEAQDVIKFRTAPIDPPHETEFVDEKKGKTDLVDELEHGLTNYDVTPRPYPQSSGLNATPLTSDEIKGLRQTISLPIVSAPYLDVQTPTTDLINSYITDKDLLVNLPTYFVWDTGMPWAEVLIMKTMHQGGMAEQRKYLQNLTSSFQGVDLKLMHIDPIDTRPWKVPTAFSTEGLGAKLNSMDIRVADLHARAKLPDFRVNMEDGLYITVPIRPLGTTQDSVVKIPNITLLTDPTRFKLKETYPYYKPFYRILGLDKNVIDSMIANLKAFFIGATDKKLKVVNRNAFRIKFLKLRSAYLAIADIVKNQYFGTSGVDAQLIRLQQIQKHHSEIVEFKLFYMVNNTINTKIEKLRSSRNEVKIKSIKGLEKKLYSNPSTNTDYDRANYNRWKLRTKYFPIIKRYEIPKSLKHLTDFPVLLSTALHNPKIIDIKEVTWVPWQYAPIEINNMASPGPIFNDTSDLKRESPQSMGLDLIMPHRILQVLKSFLSKPDDVVLNSLKWLTTVDPKPKPEVYDKKKGSKNRNIFAPNSCAHIVPQFCFNPYKYAPNYLHHRDSRSLLRFSMAQGGVEILLSYLRQFKRARILVYADNIYVYYSGLWLSLDVRRMEASHTIQSLYYELSRLLEYGWNFNEFAGRTDVATILQEVEWLLEENHLGLDRKTLGDNLDERFKFWATATKPEIQRLFPKVNNIVYDDQDRPVGAYWVALRREYFKMDIHTTLPPIYIDYMTKLYPSIATKVRAILGGYQIMLPGLASGTMGTAQLNTALASTLIEPLMHVKKEKYMQLASVVAGDEIPVDHPVADAARGSGLILTVEHVTDIWTNTETKLDLLGFDIYHFNGYGVDAQIAVLSRLRAMRSLLWHKFELNKELAKVPFAVATLKLVVYNTMYLVRYWMDEELGAVVQGAARFVAAELRSYTAAAVSRESMETLIKDLIDDEHQELTHIYESVIDSARDGVVFCMEDVLRIMAKPLHVALIPPDETFVLLVTIRTLSEHFLTFRDSSSFKLGKPSTDGKWASWFETYSMETRIDGPFNYKSFGSPSDEPYHYTVNDGTYVYEGQQIGVFDNKTPIFAPNDGRLVFIEDVVQACLEPIPDMKFLNNILSMTQESLLINMASLQDLLLLYIWEISPNGAIPVFEISVEDSDRNIFVQNVKDTKLATILLTDITMSKFARPKLGADEALSEQPSKLPSIFELGTDTGFHIPSSTNVNLPSNSTTAGYMGSYQTLDNKQFSHYVLNNLDKELKLKWRSNITINDYFGFSSEHKSPLLIGVDNAKSFRRFFRREFLRALNLPPDDYQRYVELIKTGVREKWKINYGHLIWDDNDTVVDIQAIQMVVDKANQEKVDELRLLRVAESERKEMKSEAINVAKGKVKGRYGKRLTLVRKIARHQKGT